MKTNLFPNRGVRHSYQKLLIALAIFSNFAVINATEEVFYGSLIRQELLPFPAFLEVSDNFPANVDQTLSVKDIICFSIDEDTLLKPALFTQYWVELNIEKYDINNTLIGTELNVKFTINYDPAEGAKFNYGYVYEFSGAHRIKITVRNRSAGLPAFLRLEAKIIIDRNYLFDCTSSPELLQKSHADLHNSTINALQVGWLKQDGAEEYDLEWSFYDTLSPTIGLATVNSNNFDFLFRNNATRITTGHTWYNVPLIYPKGRIYWRVRGAKYKNGAREIGKWTSVKSSSSPFDIRKEWYWVDPHEQGLNWQVQAVFAEEGKKSQSITYFDGSLRNRQNVVRSDAINTIIASETIYDSLGRATVQVMPAPVSFGTGVNDWTRGINYIPSYSAALGKSHYGAEDIAFSNAKCAFDIYNPTAKMDTAVSAVGRYYSSNNPWKDRLINKFTPASDAYPFATTEYMPDGTGRIRRQGGVGGTFQIGSQHETKYYYAKPDQEEIDRLFGNEAGIASHYQKNAVQDPNGQLSVSYIDAHGRTIATALAGSAPKDGASDRLKQLDNFNASVRIKKELLNNVRTDLALTTTTTLFVSTNGTRDSIIYGFYPPLELSLDSCLKLPRCYDCKYDLEIKVLNECGEAIVDFSKSNFLAGQLDTFCGILPDTIFRVFDLNPGLPIGQYQLEKTIKVSEQALEYYADDYIQHLTCLPTIEELQNQFLGDTTCHQTCQECFEELGSIEDFRTEYLDGVPTPYTQEDLDNADTIYYQAFRNCSDICDEGDPSDCGIMYAQMLEDIKPGGQYAEYETSVPVNPDDDLWYLESADVTSVFHLASGETLYPFQKVVELDGGANFYLNEIGQKDYILRPDLTKVRIDSLTLNEFISNFKQSWAKTLVKAHPQYCQYLCCNDNANPPWDSMFSTVTTYSDAVAAGYLPIGTLLGNDPFFNNNPTLSDSMLTTWNAYVYTAPGECSSPISLTEILISVVYCGGNLPCNFMPGGPCTADNDMYWQLVQSHYLSEKSRLKWNKIRGGGCDTPNPAIPSCISYNELCFGNPTCGVVNPNPFENKINRIYFTPPPPSTLDAQNTLLGLVDSVKTSLGDACAATCSVMAEQWIEKLKETCSTISMASQAQLDDLLDRFIAVCEGGCNTAHPYGSVSTSGTLTSFGDLTLQDAITHVFSSLNACDVNCSAELIDFPGTYASPQYLDGVIQIKNYDSCRCARITALDACWEAVGEPSLLSYINNSSNVHLTQEQLTKLQEGCNTECVFMNEPIQVPPILECNTCKTLTEVRTEWNSYISGCGDTSSIAQKKLVAAHLNHFFGLNRTYSDYRFFVEDGPLDNPGCRYLCPFTNYPEVEVDESCVTPELLEATLILATMTDQNIRDSIRLVFIKKYLAKCLGPELTEQFEARISQGEYHYTLYYYDQAGNLVRTVPPKGVTPLSSTVDLTAVKNHRLNPVNPPKYPIHNLNTRYWYNGLNQIVRDSTPDRGVGNYWYDRLGRLVLSQNAKQALLRDYTYTLFDPLGRVIETGRVTKNGLGLATLGIVWNYADFVTWLGQNLVGTFEVTHSYYDDILPGSSTVLSPFFPNIGAANGQINLRNRIASVSFEETKDSDPLTYNYATHYSYDLAGNVKQMLQDMPELNISSQANHRFKRIGYDYDLISGKVNFVHYQRDSIDQFIHHYVYDADNRVQFVETSRDGLIWERDANYEYYLHGPLGRTELGERRVQGMDYAYTLQGWLKGVNSSALSLDSPNTADFLTRDMGRDGKSSNTGDFARNKDVARDVMAFTLGYYYGEYRKVNTTAGDNFELTNISTSGFNLASSSLYNGNIRHAVYSIAKLNETSGYAQPEGFAYKYDQLNRLVSQREYIDYTLGAAYRWNSGSPFRAHFLEDITYDPNGNILSYLRNGNNTAQFMMDNLNYNYEVNTNKLNSIDDAQLNQAAYISDLEDQAANNYLYDAIGNLTRDVRDSVNLITWTNAQKIRSITKTDRSISFSYNPMQQRVAKYSKPNNSILEKRTYYVRDAQGNVMATYAGYVKNSGGSIIWDSLRISEQHIYGSSRVGMALTTVKLYPQIPKNPHTPDTSHYSIYEGWKRYELSNHLGNVLATITDRKRAKASSGTTIQWYEADVVSAQQYYPFGMLMPGNASTNLRRQYTLTGNDYRYGFNGKEGDDEVKGDDNQQDYGMRIYDPRAGRFLSVDPLMREYPWYTPYQFAGNMPVKYIDLDGLEPENNPSDYKGISEVMGIEVVSRIRGHAAEQNSKANKETPPSKRVLLGEDIRSGYGNYFTDTDTKSANEHNMFVNDNYSRVVSESNASDFGDYEKFVVDELLGNFVSGNGPQNYIFPKNGIISSKFLKSDVLNSALDDYYAGGHSPMGEQYGFAGNELISDTWRNNGNVFNITGFVGSAFIKINTSEDNAFLNIYIFNITSLTSGALFKGKIYEEKYFYPTSFVRDQNSASPTYYGNISQLFELQIPKNN